MTLYFLFSKISLKQFLVLFLWNIYIECWVALLSNRTIFRKELFLWALRYVPPGVTQTSLRNEKCWQTCELTDHRDPQLLYCHLSLWHPHGFPSNLWEKTFFQAPWGDNGMNVWSEGHRLESIKEVQVHR